MLFCLSLCRWFTYTYNNSKYFKEKYYKTVQSADIVFTPGTILYNELIELNNNTFRISHGVKKENFFKDKNTEPTEIDNIDQDIIVYSGTLANWVDYELLCYLCKMFPSKKFLFLGYIHALTPSKSIVKLKKHNNILMPGFIKYEKLKNYYEKSRVAIVPYQQQNEHIIYSSPTKFYDYLASGLPVVSTKFPAANEYDDLVYVAENHQDFVRGIQYVIDNDNDMLKEKRIKFSKNLTWDKQVEKMLKLIFEER